ncbi:flagellar protein FlaG [Robertmurraya sp. P23]|uniref:flagellar protein FlaG n=1 Tax=Robertmurraya sp. P23 TaxID=3436931 RepID=UPI003D97D669
MIDRIQSTGVFSSQNRPSTVDNNGTEVIPTNKQEQESEIIPKGTQSKEQVEEVVKGLNDFLSPTQTSLKFELHEKLNEYYVTLVDDKTQQVVREIPSKKMLDFYAAMTEFIGIMVDKKI